jgi:transcription termination factor NusB
MSDSLLPKKISMHFKKDVNDSLLTFIIRKSRLHAVALIYSYKILTLSSNISEEEALKKAIEDLNKNITAKQLDQFNKEKKPMIDVEYSTSIARNILKIKPFASNTIPKYLKNNSYLDITLESIILAAISEMNLNQKISSSIIISEYTRIATLFFSKKIVGFMNAILDKISKHREEIILL